MRPNLRRSLLGLILACGCLLRVDGREAERPNVLFLAVDDMRDWVGCLEGYSGRVSTPNIDALAERGTLFTNAHCPSPKCAPSRAAILTGLMPSTTGLYDNGHWWYPNLPEVRTLPRHFKAHGYHTVGAGKIFHHTAGNHPPNQWDAFFRHPFRNDPWFRSSRLNYPWSESGPNPPGFPFGQVRGLGHENDWGSLEIPDAEYDDARCLDFAIQFLKSDRVREPFFLACGIFRPHLPWYVPARFFERYPEESIQLPPLREGDEADLPPIARALAQAGREDFERIRDARRWRSAIRAYLASISYADDLIGQLLAALDRSGQAARTIVVLWSDHGWHLGEKGHWHKSTLWEAATRVPFVMAGPGIRASRCEEPVSLVDLYPTLIELCGLNAVSGLDGLSLVPQLKDPAALRSRPAIIEFRKGNAAVRTKRYRLIQYADGQQELYDHRRDPHEWENLVDDPKQSALRADLARWLPQQWALSAPTKRAFDFDPQAFTWTEKATGRVLSGRP